MVCGDRPLRRQSLVRPRSGLGSRLPLCRRNLSHACPRLDRGSRLRQGSWRHTQRPQVVRRRAVTTIPGRRFCRRRFRCVASTMAHRSRIARRSFRGAARRRRHLVDAQPLPTARSPTHPWIGPAWVVDRRRRPYIDDTRHEARSTRWPVPSFSRKQVCNSSTAAALRRNPTTPRRLQKSTELQWKRPARLSLNTVQIEKPPIKRRAG